MTPFVDTGKNEKGEVEFSIHGLNEDDLLWLHQALKRINFRTQHYSKLFDAEINDLVLMRGKPIEGAKLAVDQIKVLNQLAFHIRKKWSRINSIIENIERASDKAFNVSQDDVPEPPQIFQSKMNTPCAT